MGDPGAIRASDADRERVADQLRDDYAAGRLTSDELSQRTDAAYAAITQGQLAELLADLPVSAAPMPPPPLGDHSLRSMSNREARELARQRVYQDAGAVVLLNLLCVAVWLLSGTEGAFWPVWVMLVSALRLSRDAWRLLGPGGDPRLATLQRSERRRLERERRRQLRR